MPVVHIHDIYHNFIRWSAYRKYDPEPDTTLDIYTFVRVFHVRRISVYIHLDRHSNNEGHGYDRFNVDVIKRR